MTLLYLVRHGETVDNANHIMQGQTQGELNDNGIRQAEELANRLKGEPIDTFVSSDLRRSIHTCELIARPHGKAVTTTPLLRERDWGSFTGKYIPNLANLNDPSLWPDDIESLEDLKDFHLIKYLFLCAMPTTYTQLKLQHANWGRLQWVVLPPL